MSRTYPATHLANARWVLLIYKQAKKECDTMDTFFFGGAMKTTSDLKKPLRILILTSVRDTGECDLNGMTIPTSNGKEYMMGAIEYLVNSASNGGSLNGIVELAGVVTDDHTSDLHNYPCAPTQGKPWIHPLDLRTTDGTLVTDVTVNIPSRFRQEPRSSLESRVRLKRAFEEAVYRLGQEWRADIILSDHYMARIVYLIGQLGMYGRVLNIHPAITIANHPYCFRGPTPTADAIARAQQEEVVTGATLHLINDVIDDGPPIAYTVGTPVFASDDPQTLRLRNYTLAKLPLLRHGLMHYALQVYPILTDIRTASLDTNFTCVP